jgi:FtsH-binding integral membrane protein
MYHGHEGKRLPMGEALTSILKEGELLFLAMGLVAAVVWMSAQDFSRARFDERIWFFIGCLGVSLASVFFIGVNPDFKTLPAVVVRDLSYFAFSMSCLMYLLMTVFTKFEANDYRRALDQSEDDLLNRLNKRKK